MLVFGRAPGCSVVIQAATVSRHHFILEANPPDARIRDLGSRNGTFVNGVKYGGRPDGETPEDAKDRLYPQVDLANGDQVSVGEVSIAVSIVMPPSCCQSGVEIDEGDKNALWMQGSHMCQACRGMMETPAMSLETRPRIIVEKLCCSQCGKDVAQETGNRRHGSYVCEACRAWIMPEEGGGVRAILRNAVKVRDGEPKPIIAGYTIGEELARGGMGCVFSAKRDSDNADVVVKVMLSPVAVEPAAVKRFQREISLTKNLRHDNIVYLLDDGVAGSIFYFIMEFCNTGDLASFANKYGGKLALPAFAPIMVQCLQGLEHANSQGVVHRDLKPQNILLHKNEQGYLAKVSDFGLAKSFEAYGLSGLTATGAMADTYPYMPREQLTNFKTVEPVSDVWSFAATFYRVLTGHLPRSTPHKMDPLQVILEVDSTPIEQRVPSIPDAVAAVFERALMSDQDQRYRDGGELRRAFDEALS